MTLISATTNPADLMFEDDPDREILAIGQAHGHFYIFTRNLYPEMRADWEAGTSHIIAGRDAITAGRGEFANISYNPDGTPAAPGKYNASRAATWPRVVARPPRIDLTRPIRMDVHPRVTATALPRCSFIVHGKNLVSVPEQGTIFVTATSMGGWMIFDAYGNFVMSDDGLGTHLKLFNSPRVVTYNARVTETDGKITNVEKVK